MWGAPALLEQAHAGDPDNQRVIPELANALIDLGEFYPVRNVLDSVRAASKPPTWKFER